MTRSRWVGLSALALAGCAASAPRAETQEALPFIQNDYARAVSEAKAKHLPLFVDTWAPW